MTLDCAQDWQDQDGTWTGPGDLSAAVTSLYDSRRLYLHADVVDDVFSQPNSLGDVWNGDSFQFAVDPNRARKPDQSGATEFGLALTARRSAGVPLDQSGRPDAACGPEGEARQCPHDV